MVKDANESLVWGVTNGMARGEHHLLARPRKIVTRQRPNLKGGGKESWNIITGSSTASKVNTIHCSPQSFPRVPVSTNSGIPRTYAVLREPHHNSLLVLTGRRVVQLLTNNPSGPDYSDHFLKALASSRRKKIG